MQAELLEQGLFSLLCIMLKQSQDGTLLLPTLSALGNLATDLDRCECCSLCWEDWQQLMPWPSLWQLCDSSDPRLQVQALGHGPILGLTPVILRIGLHVMSIRLEQEASSALETRERRGECFARRLRPQSVWRPPDDTGAASMKAPCTNVSSSAGAKGWLQSCLHGGAYDDALQACSTPLMLLYGHAGAVHGAGAEPMPVCTPQHAAPSPAGRGAGHADTGR